jgi:hypothetical protein
VSFSHFVAVAISPLAGQSWDQWRAGMSSCAIKIVVAAISPIAGAGRTVLSVDEKLSGNGN